MTTERTRFLLGGAGLLAVFVGMMLLAFRDPQSFFDPQTVSGLVLTALGALVSLLFRPGRELVGPVKSWTGPAVVIGLVVLIACAVALLFAMDHPSR